MTDTAPTPSAAPSRLTVERYFALADTGALDHEDRVELLEGRVVAMSPRNARHDAGVTRVAEALRVAVGRDAVVRVQCSLVLAPHSVPEPDVAVVPGDLSTYDNAHPTTALLVVEVADASLQQDRTTKAALYAAARIPEYWIVNVRDDRVEIHRGPAAGRYAELRIATVGQLLSVVELPGVRVPADALLPRR